jgi:transcriptional regulator with XRE-family HTH domain
MKIPDMQVSSPHTPHKQLKAIRERLDITQRTAAAMLGVSYPYFLSVETGQRELSDPLAQKVARTFGVVRIQKKDEEPLIRDSTGKLVSFTKGEYSRYVSSRPSFWIDDDFAGPEGAHKVTPTLRDYARCAHALLDAAEKEATLGPVLADFFSWFARSITTESMYERLKQSFDHLFPGERAKSDAYLALTIKWGLQVENEVFKNQARKAKAAARAATKPRKNRQEDHEKKALPTQELSAKKSRRR